MLKVYIRTVYDSKKSLSVLHNILSKKVVIDYINVINRENGSTTLDVDVSKSVMVSLSSKSYTEIVKRLLSQNNRDVDMEARVYSNVEIELSIPTKDINTKNDVGEFIHELLQHTAYHKFYVDSDILLNHDDPNNVILFIDETVTDTQVVLQILSTILK